MLFGTMSLGEVAVSGFFLLSGYLVTKSWVVGGAEGYFERRALRIVPGFLAAYLLSLLLFGGLAGADVAGFGKVGWATAVLRALLLLPPQGLEGAYSQLPTPVLNGSMGTIAYEFRCYLLVAALAPLGLYRHRRLYLFLAGAVLATGLLMPILKAPDLIEAVLGEPRRGLRFCGVFMAGAVFFLYRDRIVCSARGAAIAGAGLVGLMFTPLAWLAFTLLGGYVLFWAAFTLRSETLQRINGRTDISYGVFLYSWPITGALILWNPQQSPWLLAIVAAAWASVAGLVSWHLVEKPALALRTKRGAESGSEGAVLTAA